MTRSSWPIAPAIRIDSRLEKLAPVRMQRQVRVVNKSGERLTVSFRYETQGTGGAWEWLPAGRRATEGQVVLEPGESRLLEDNGPIAARTMRIWAVGGSTGLRWDRDRDRDVTVMTGSYRLRSIDTYTYTFTK